MDDTPCTEFKSSNIDLSAISYRLHPFQPKKNSPEKLSNPQILSLNFGLYLKTIALVCFSVSVFTICVCQAQGVERCDRRIVQKEQFSLPHLNDAEDSAGKQILEELREKAQWTDQVLDSGIIVEGTLTYPSGDKRPIKLFLKGKHRLRIEESSPTGLRVLSTDGFQATRQSSGQISSTSVDALLTEGSYLPFMSDITATKNEIRLVEARKGNDAKSEQKSYRIFHFSFGFSPADNGTKVTPYRPHRETGRTTEAIVRFDATTLLPIEIEECSPLVGNSNTFRSVKRNFSGYTAKDGVTFPAHIEEKIGDERNYVLDIVSFETNQKLPDSTWTPKAN